jgi:oligopeptide transport system permease protein
MNTTTLDTKIESGKSPWQVAWQRFTRHRSAVVALVLLCAIVVACIAGPWLSPYSGEETDWSMMSAAPGFADTHYFGTDALGRDLFVRTLEGGRISLAVGLAATLVSLLIGVSWGAIAGYAGGRVDAVMMRFTDILYALPFLFFVILLMVMFGRNLFLMFIAIGAVNWLDMARIVRGQTLSLREKEFIMAARAMGQRPIVIITRDILPNLLGVVIVYATLTVPQVILVESFLSFLGLGVQEPDTSWGALVNEGAREMETAPWMLLFPAGFLAATLFALNFIGDGLRDALDPKE